MRVPYFLPVAGAALVLLSAPPAKAQWTEQASGFATPNRYIFTIDAVDDDVVWALAGDVNFSPIQEFTKTTDSGANWIPGAISGASGLVACDITALDANTAWAALTHLPQTLPAGIFKTTDGGATWVRQSTAFPNAGSFVDILHFFDANNGVTVGDPLGGYFEIYTTTNGGTNWTRVPQGNIPSPLAGEFGLTLPGPSFAAVGNTVWFGTNKGRVFRSTNQGANWSASSAGIGPSTWITVAFADASHGLAVSAFPIHLVSKTTDGGSSWTAMTAAPFGLCVAGVPGGAFVVTEYRALRADDGSAYTLDGGSSWTGVDTAPHGPSDFVNPNVGWSGGINRSSTEGGMWKWTGTALSVAEAGAPEPSSLVFTQSSPNPFGTATTIEFSIPHSGRVMLKVFNARGEEITTLVNRELAQGRYAERWNADRVPSGVHFYRLQFGDHVETRKLVRVR